MAIGISAGSTIASWIASGGFNSRPENATGILRVASPFNRIPNNKTWPNGAPAYAPMYSGRHMHYIGSGSCYELRACFNNFILDTFSTPNTGNDVTVHEVWLEDGVTGINAPVTVGGQFSFTLSDGAYDIRSDPIRPSAFGLAFFPLGRRFFFRHRWSCASGGTFPAIRFSDTQSSAGYHYNPALTTITNVNGTGPLAWTGPQPTFFRGPAPILLGCFIEGDPITFLGVGDSIFDGAGDASGATQEVGAAYFSRAVASPTPGTYPLGALNTGISAGKVSAWHGGGGTTPRANIFSTVKYCNRTIFEFGTNEFDQSPNTTTNGLNAIWNLVPAFLNYIRAYQSAEAGASPMRITGCTLMPRTQAPTGNGPTDQIVWGPRWDVGGDATEYVNRMKTLKDAGIIEYMLDTATLTRFDPSSELNSFYHRWPQGALSALDGTHPNTNIHTTVGAALRQLMLMQTEDLFAEDGQPLIDDNNFPLQAER
jgi:hypothetical protein